MAEPTKKIAAVLVDGTGAHVGSPQFFATMREAENGGGEMLRLSQQSGLECYFYEVTGRIVMKIAFRAEKLATRIASDPVVR